jgi:hypothetical protein
VTPDDLAVWNQFPHAAFTLVELPSSHDESREDGNVEGDVRGEEFHLGTFDLPLPPDDEQLH